MLTNNFAAYGLKILIELAGDILYFPLWWYSRGLFNAVKAQLAFLENRQKGLALSVWIKNIFKPMYGQYDWQGFLISFFIRLIQIFFRGILMIVYVMISIAAVIAWIALPPFVLYEILMNL